jgi:hypothetical protein
MPTIKRKSKSKGNLPWQQLTLRQAQVRTIFGNVFYVEEVKAARIALAYYLEKAKKDGDQETIEMIEEERIVHGD